MYRNRLQQTLVAVQPTPTHRELSVRSFDKDEMMIDAAVIEGHELAGTCQAFFEHEDSDKIHVHNATRGCWAVTVGRTMSDQAGTL